LKTWPKGGPKVLWRVPLGEGYSSISVANGLAYTMYDEGNDEYLACFDALTGNGACAPTTSFATIGATARA
jgi:hypothetical protein